MALMLLEKSKFAGFFHVWLWFLLIMSADGAVKLMKNVWKLQNIFNIVLLHMYTRFLRETISRPSALVKMQTLASSQNVCFIRTRSEHFALYFSPINNVNSVYMPQYCGFPPWLHYLLFIYSRLLYLSCGAADLFLHLIYRSVQHLPCFHKSLPCLWDINESDQVLYSPSGSDIGLIACLVRCPICSLFSLL